ncbi:MAG: hypothetical protein Q8R24_10140 [Legionellaceae bacterium]|nr:hypothetical protein [Legionellaceae bacterium]
MVIIDQSLNIRARLRLAFYPFCMILFGMIFGCSVVNWILFIRPEKFNYNPDLLYLYTPLILSFFAVLIRFKRIIIKLSHLDGHTKTKIVYYLASVVLITTSTYYSQVLLEDFSAKVVHLNDISDIYDHKIAKFFTVDNYHVEKTSFGHYFSIKRDRYKGHVGLIMDMFFVFPVFSQHYQDPVVWIGVHFNKSTGTDYLFWEDLEPFRLRFVNDTFNQAFMMPLDKFDYLELLSDSFINNSFYEALKDSELKLSHHQIVLLGHYEPLKDRLNADIYHVIMALIASLLIWLFIITPPINWDKYSARRIKND